MRPFAISSTVPYVTGGGAARSMDTGGSKGICLVHEEVLGISAYEGWDTALIDGIRELD